MYLRGKHSSNGSYDADNTEKFELSIAQQSNTNQLYAIKRDVFVNKLVLFRDKDENIPHGKCLWTTDKRAEPVKLQTCIFDLYLKL